MLTDAALSALLSVLNTNGEEARIVGGAVRDAVMGRAFGDIDIATTALPFEVTARAQAAGWKVVPTGIAHGTVTVVIGGIPYEVTTLRQDVSTDGRRAVVSFTRDFRDDAFRRDFTLNALSMERDGRIHDYATGLRDALNGRIRFMGVPEERIEEDYLRILRFFRFHASHGRGSPDTAGLSACAALKDSLARLSRERIRQELVKLLVAPGALTAIEAMDAITLWPAIIPKLVPDIAAFSRVVMLENELGQNPDALLRLKALCGALSSADLALKLSRQEEARLAALEQYADDFTDALPDKAQVRRLVFGTRQHFIPTLILHHARKQIDPDRTRTWLETAHPVLLDPPRNPFRAADALRLGVTAGPRMGKVLGAALALWLEAGLPTNRSTHAQLLRQAVDANPE